MIPDSSSISARVKRRTKAPIVRDENVARYDDNDSENVRPMDIDQRNDPFVTPSKALRNVRLSPAAKARRKNIESSPQDPLIKVVNYVSDSGM